MADPTSQNAARLTEDIGDVLTAIRRLIADDKVSQNHPPGKSAPAGDSLSGRRNSMITDRLAAHSVEGQASRRRLRLDVTRRVDLAPGFSAVGIPQAAMRGRAAETADYLEEDDFAAAFAWKERGGRAGASCNDADIPPADPFALGSACKEVGMRAREAVATSVTPHAPASAPPPMADESDKDLRQLLREIIREELQGELGAKFSGNLRSLVRCEIAKALDVRHDVF